MKHSLAKILSKEQQASWDIYLNFAVFSYNLSVHSSTGFTPIYLTFGSEARLPPDIVFGSPVPAFDNGQTIPGRTTGTPLTLLLKSFSVLTRSFEVVRENLHSFHQREKDRYDHGAIDRIFKERDQVRVRLKSRQKGNSKYLPKWSGPHEVLKVRGFVVTLRELSTGREYNTHHDRLSNPLLSGQKGLPETVPEHEPNANPEENLKEPEEDSEPVGNPEEALMRTRSGRVVRPRRDRNFDYTGVLLQFGFIPTSNTTCSLTSVYSFSISDHILQPLSIDTCFAHAPLRAHANLRSMPLVQESMMRRG